jgi:two-component system, NtrC family, response regulator AtoC
MARLLVAEDDHLMRWSLENFLSRGGYAVHSVGSGEGAIDAVKGGNYQVVITDYSLPGSDGLDVLWWVKAQSPETHVIIITGHPMPKLERLARDVGAFDLFEKPFQFLALKQSVERALSTPERRTGPRTCCGNCTWQVPCGFWFEKAAWKPN